MKSHSATKVGLYTAPALLANYLLSRYLAPLTAFLTKLQGRYLYTPANYKYEAGVTRFDATILTYGTDYLIAIFMLYISYVLFTIKRIPQNSKLIDFSGSLILSYSLSTFTGALCHQFLSDVSSMNSFLFRILWGICVGSVGLAGGILGAAGSEIARLEQKGKKKDVLDLFIIPEAYWIAHGLFFLFVIIFGFFSMTTPACDIFLAGVSQTLPHFYCILALMVRGQDHYSAYGISQRTRKLMIIGLLLNVPLLPGYDLLTSLRLPLGIINLILHSNLAVAWGLQGYGFYKISVGITNSR